MEEVAKAVGGGCCRLQMPLRLALGGSGRQWLGVGWAPCRGGGGLPPFQYIPGGVGSQSPLAVSRRVKANQGLSAQGTNESATAPSLFSLSLSLYVSRSSRLPLARLPFAASTRIALGPRQGSSAASRPWLPQTGPQQRTPQTCCPHRRGFGGLGCKGGWLWFTATSSDRACHTPGLHCPELSESFFSVRPGRVPRRRYHGGLGCGGPGPTRHRHYTALSGAVVDRLGLVIAVSRCPRTDAQHSSSVASPQTLVRVRSLRLQPRLPPSPPAGGCIGMGGRCPPLGAQPMPSHCPPDAKRQLQWHL